MKTEAEALGHLRQLTKLVGSAWTGGHMIQLIGGAGLLCPDQMVDMYLRNEPDAYIAAAVMAVNGGGE